MPMTMRDSDTPLDGAADLRFRLYDAAADGLQIGPEASFAALEITAGKPVEALPGERLPASVVLPDGTGLVVALGDELAGRQEVVPGVGRHLEHFQVAEPWLAFEEDGFGEPTGERRLAELRRRVQQDRLLAEIGDWFGALRG